MSSQKSFIAVFAFALLSMRAALAADFTGFWKVDCSDAFGIQIKPYSGNIFSVSFCAPGGCFAPGTWKPNTTIEGDPGYRVIDPSTLEIPHGEGWLRYRKCSKDTNPVLDYSTMKDSKRDGGVTFFEPNRGLPDYRGSSPFTVRDPKLHQYLRNQLLATTESAKDCRIGEVNIPNLRNTPLYSNICGGNKIKELKERVAALAPSLNRDNITLWKSDLTGDGEPDVLVGHVDISKDKHFGYPYLSLWVLDFKQGRYEARFGGSFLAGEVHTVRRFEHNSKPKMVFVRHWSCIECHPWIYLTILDFSQMSVAEAYQFTYAKDHKKYGDALEYRLPGKGHSVDADVETRILKANILNPPHLIQTFRLTEEKKVEWWVFSCKQFRCDYEFYEESLPEKYRSLWEFAERL